jgi:hypothetical protein
MCITLSVLHVHRCAYWEYRRKRTPGSTFLRALLSKFAKVSNNMMPQDFGPTYEGGEPAPLTAEEDRLRTLAPQLLNAHLGSLFAR